MVTTAAFELAAPASGATISPTSAFFFRTVPSKGAMLFENSWGPDWGLDGQFLIRYADVTRLLERQGELRAGLLRRQRDDHALPMRYFGGIAIIDLTLLFNSSG